MATGHALQNRYPAGIAIFTDALTDGELELLARLDAGVGTRFVSAHCRQCARSANLRLLVLFSGWFCTCGYYNGPRLLAGVALETPDQGPSLARLHAAGIPDLPSDSPYLNTPYQPIVLVPA